MNRSSKQSREANSATVMAVVPRPKPTSISQPRHKPAAQASIELYWLPLGAGGWFVRLNGGLYEAIHASRSPPIAIEEARRRIH